MKAWRRGGVKGYKEKHHIIPRCQGGGNDKANLVELTAAEHYIAHLLLMRMYPDNYKLAYPILLMGKSLGRGTKNKLYDKAKKFVSEGQKNRVLSEKTRAKMSAASKGHKRTLGIKHTAESRANMSAAQKGKKLSEEHISRMSASLKGRTMSDETCAKMSLAKKGNKYALGTKRSDETRAKISAAQKGKKKSPESTAKRLATLAKNKERKELLQFWCAL